MSKPEDTFIDPQVFMNILFYIYVRKMGGSINITNDDLKAVAVNEVGALQLEQKETGVTLSCVDPVTAAAYKESLNNGHH